MLLLALSLLIGTLSSPDALPPDTTSAGEGLRTRFAVLLNPIWSSPTGFGIGAALDVEHLVAPGTRLRLVARPSQHLGRYGATFYTADPRASRFYGLVNGFYETMGRQWFYGLGPGAGTDRLAIERERTEVELRLGTSLFDGRVFVQPLLRFARHRVAGYREWDDGALAGLSEASRANLDSLVPSVSREARGSDRHHGLAYGLSAGLDTRDARVRATRGALLQAGLVRYASVDEPDIRFDHVETSAYVFVPTGRLLPVGPGGQVLALRVLAERAFDRGDAPVPFFLLPSLSRHQVPGLAWDRFFGNDLLAVSAEYRFLVFAGFGLIGVEGLLSVHAASVYDDLFDQFSPRLSFDEIASPSAGRFPLRPSLGVGARIVSLFDDRVFLEGNLGFAPGGLHLARFGLVFDLRDLPWYKQ